MTHAGAVAALYVEPLNDAADEFDIDNPDRLSAFLATIAVESRELTRTSENLNYSSAAHIADVWPARFPSATHAAPYVNQPEMLANVVYANRMGNGPVESGDGWRYRGAGLIQITLKDNHRACAQHFRMDLETVGNWMRTPIGAARSAGFYWWRNALNPLADQGQFATLTRKVNRASEGMTQRLEFYGRARKVLGCDDA